MTETERQIGSDSIYAQRETIREPATARPWPLVAPATVAIASVAVGSLGPWIEYETVSETVPATWTLSGPNTDGLFSLILASVALVALGVALFREGNESWAWIAFGAMALCAVIGVFDWLLLVPIQPDLAPGETGTVERLGWGAKVVGVLGPIGALATFLVARRLNRDGF